MVLTGRATGPTPLLPIYRPQYCAPHQDCSLLQGSLAQGNWIRRSRVQAMVPPETEMCRQQPGLCECAHSGLLPRSGCVCLWRCVVACNPRPGDSLQQAPNAM